MTKFRVYLQSDSEILNSNNVADRLSDLILDEIKEHLDKNPQISEEIEFTVDIRNIMSSKFTLEEKDIVIEKIK